MKKHLTINESNVEKKSLDSATVEEALDVAGFGKYNYGLLLICSWTLQAMGLDLFGVSFVVTAAVCDLDLSMQQRALLTAMPLAGVVAGAQLWGYISDTKGRRLTLVISMSIGFVFAALSSFAPDWKTMAVLKLIASTFTSASNSGAYTLLGESCPGWSRGRAMLLCTCSLMSSQGLAAVFAYPILPLQFSYPIPFLGITYRSWRLLSLVLSLPCATSAVLLQLFHESPKFLASRGQYGDALYVLKKIYARNSGEHMEIFSVRKLIKEQEDHSEESKESFLKAMWQQTIALFRPPLLKVTLKLFYLVSVIYMTGSGFILWLPYIMNSMFSVLENGSGGGMNLCVVIKHHNSEAAAALLLNETSADVCNDTIQETTLLSAMTYGALVTSANLILSLTCGGRKRMAMMGILTMSATSAVLLNLVRVPIAGGFFFFFFMMCALCMGILSVYCVELYPTSLRGMVSCLTVMLGRFMAFLGVNAIGAMIPVNCEATFYGWSILLLSAIVFTWFLPKDKPIDRK